MPPPTTDVRYALPAEPSMRNAHVHIELAELAERQHGVVSARQVHVLGVPRSVVVDWLRSGRLRPVHRGVYAVGWMSTSFQSRCMAAILAAGPGSLITGSAAAYLRGLVRQAPTVIDVLNSRQRRRHVDGVRIVRGLVAPEDRSSVDGIPTASVARALADQADRVVATKLAAVMHEAEYQSCLNVPAVRRCNDRRRTRRGRGHRRLAAALELHESGSAGTQSFLERRSLDRLIEGGAPMPEITPMLVLERRRIRPDFLYRSRMLVIEIDGTPHDRNRTKNQDQIKTEELEAVGYRVRRVGYRTWRRDIDAILREEFGCDPRCSR